MSQLLSQLQIHLCGSASLPLFSSLVNSLSESSGPSILAITLCSAVTTLHLFFVHVSTLSPL